MTKYRKRPIEVEAIVYEANNVQAIARFIGETQEGRMIRLGEDWDEPGWPRRIWIEKSNAWGRIEVGDAVIRESDGSGVYPCVKAVFEATYEPVEES